MRDLYLRAIHAPALLKRISSTGDILVHWNNVASKSNWPRTPLTAAISKDECQTWTHYHDIDNRPNFDAAYLSCTLSNSHANIGATPLIDAHDPRIPRIADLGWNSRFHPPEST